MINGREVEQETKLGYNNMFETSFWTVNTMKLCDKFRGEMLTTQRHLKPDEETQLHADFISEVPKIM